MITAGTHKVESILSCFIGESPTKKTAYFCLELQLENGETIDWIAWLSDKDEKAIAAANRNVETLKRLGYLKPAIEEMANPKNEMTDLFGDPEDKVSIVVEIKEFTKGNGTTGERPEIKYVNVGESNSSNLTKFDHKTAVVKFKTLPFNGTLKKLLSGEKLPSKPKATPPPLETPGFVDADVPF